MAFDFQVKTPPPSPSTGSGQALPHGGRNLSPSHREGLGEGCEAGKNLSALPSLFQLIRDKSERQTQQVRFRDVGTVQHVGNGIAILSGLPYAQLNELVIFPTGVRGLVLNLEKQQVDVILLGEEEGLHGGMLVEGSGDLLQVPVGSELLGRVVNPLCQPLDGQSKLDTGRWLPIEREAPGIVWRMPVDEPLLTGWKMVDALIPIGRGQRELILGDRQTGKTTLALDTILNQQSQGVVSVYVAIGQKKATALQVVETLRQHDALDDTVVVLASPDDPPALRYIAPYVGCTLAEGLRDEGRDVLIVYDDLTKHAEAYRELSLLLRRPPGREAYPGDIFYLHSRLLERAGRLHPDFGGGSLTALPIVQTQQGDVSAYIPTNLISITDGQIILDRTLFNRGLRPAVNVGLSVSRVGGAAQMAAMQAVAGRLRLELTQFEEVAHFSRLGTDVDEATQQQIERGERLQMVLHQGVHRPFSAGEQVVVLYAATHGFLDGVALAQLGQVESELLAYLAAEQDQLLTRLQANGAWDEGLEAEVVAALQAWERTR